MAFKPLLFFIISTGVVSVASANIFGDLLGWDIVGALTGGVQEKKSPSAQREEEEGTSSCVCEGQICNCCVDFNLTSIIDLGGPGCVRMRYISQDEGVALNVSYGDSLLHSHIVKQKDKKGSCMDLLSEFAQICARFAALKPTDDGLEGCLHFEPHVLGEVTAKYHIGCFKMGPEGMVQDNNAQDPEEEQEEEDEDEKQPSGEDDEDVEPASILEVVNHSAEQGIAFFTDLLGLKTPSKKNKTTTVKPVEEPAEAEETTEEAEESQEEARKLKVVKTRLGRLHLANNAV